MISIENINVIYNSNSRTTEALKNVSFDINKSDFVCLLGPSGCGKSTLLNVIAGFQKPTNGKVVMNNKEILNPGRDRVVVFQATNLFPWLTIEDNIKYGLKISKKNPKEIENLTKKYLEKIELTKYSKHYPYELSGGMKQRVALARTLINEPDITLLDEPFGALDAITRASMQRFIRELWSKEKQTFLLITHDIDEALSLGNRVLVMSKNPGTILEEFTIDFYKELLVDPYAVLEDNPEYPRLKHKILKLIDNK